MGLEGVVVRLAVVREAVLAEQVARLVAGQADLVGQAVWEELELVDSVELAAQVVAEWEVLVVALSEVQVAALPAVGWAADWFARRSRSR